MSQDLASENYRKLVKHVSLICGVHVTTAEHILRYYFSFIRDTFKRGDLESIRLKYLGVFACKPGRKEYLDEQDEKRRNSNSGGNEELDISESGD